MIVGAHAIVYSKDAEADRAFLRDVLELPSVDVGEGWLVFGLPPSEIAVHPAARSGKQELYLLVRDIRVFVASMRERGLRCGEPADRGWGLLADLTLPGGGTIGVYEPRHLRPRQPTPRATARAKKARGPLDPREIASWRIEPDEKAVERYFEKLALPIRIIAKELDAIARKELRGCTIGMKWSVPHYGLRGPVCYISAAKKHVNFGLHQGINVPDPSGLLEGTKKSPIRKVIFPAGAEVPKAVVRGWLREAKKVDMDWGK